jgi:hypothetical protein
MVSLVPLLCFLRIRDRWNVDDPGFNKYYMLYAKELQEKLPVDQKCIVDYDDSKYIALYYFKRQGFSLYPDQVNESYIEKYYLKGGNYFITGNHSFDTSAFRKLNFTPIFDRELKVYKISTR